MDELKECTDCRKIKPIKSFRLYNSNGYVYRRSWCIECERIRYKRGGVYNKKNKPKRGKSILEKIFNY